MAAPLQFKAYDPACRKPRKPKRIASAAPRKHHGDNAETRHDGQASQSVAEGYLEMNNQEDVMTVDLTDLDVCDDLESVRQLVETCMASTLCGNEVRGHASTSLSPAPQLNLSTETPETNPGDIQNQDSVLMAEANPQTRVDGIAPTIPASLRAAMDLTVNGANDVALAAMRQPRAATTTQLPDLSRLSAHQRGSVTSISSPALSISPSTREDTGSQSLESLFNDETGFQRWLDAEQRQDSAPSSKRLNRPLDDSGYDSSSEDQREAKRPKLSSTAECGTLLREPDVCESALAPDDTVTAHHASRRLLPTRHIEGNPISPSAGTRSGAAACLPSRTAVKFATRGDVTTSQSHIDSLRPPPPMALPAGFRGGQEIDQSGQCNLCAIFRAALFETLSLLHHPSHTAVSNTQRHAQPRSIVSKRRYSLRKRPTPLENGCEDSDDNPVSYMDKHCNGSDDGGIVSDENEDDDSLSDTDKSRNVSVKRRRWSDLEESRLRAGKRENKSESWIASKLDRTVSAVKQQWRKMSEDKS
ncbi:Myb domain protein [Metarhizium robertsii]|uniref:Myb-like domain-containing protein n=2 Tax=Metarhizium robertsii TaxID=568076 RepID=E9FDZ2_METRA|nr:uncharacterized protein MAA_10491 [Metarhizium robertsii ARSEF 23]EFY94049.1 hypothetical protein MAA_10491 [Metarhizium robertsii ARSEF 23]EXU95777.1 Myb domain protein [Metarhizium robertsii]